MSKYDISYLIVKTAHDLEELEVRLHSEFTPDQVKDELDQIELSLAEIRIAFRDFFRSRIQ